ncbi:UNVERIFIED_CONTAM: hypothetical protein NCL1_45537 [Trichonephila clavipes]
MEVTRVEQRSYIKIAVHRDENAMEYHSELVEALGNNALPYHTVARWKEENISARTEPTGKPVVVRFR